VVVGEDVWQTKAVGKPRKAKTKEGSLSLRAEGGGAQKRGKKCTWETIRNTVSIGGVSSGPEGKY